MARLTEGEKHFGPITYGRSNWAAVRVCWSSGVDEDSDAKKNTLTVNAFGWVARVYLPKILRSQRTRHYPEWDDATVLRIGRNWYDTFFPREYGFCVSDGHLSVYLGAQTYDSNTTKRWGCLLPWTQWRFIRQSWYGPTGQHIETLWESSSREVRRAQSDWRYEFEKTLAKTSFQIKDYDGALIVCDTNIEEREWRFGEGWFKWLSWFRKPMIRRSLNLSFREEVGPEKGSWKGGLCGTGIDMEPGELHESAMRRYCEMEHRAKYNKYRITFVGGAA